MQHPCACCCTKDAVVVVRNIWFNGPAVACGGVGSLPDGRRGARLEAVKEGFTFHLAIREGGGWTGHKKAGTPWTTEPAEE